MAAKACTYPLCLDFAAYAVISKSIIERNKSISRHEWSSEYLSIRNSNRETGLFADSDTCRKYFLTLKVGACIMKHHPNNSRFR